MPPLTRLSSDALTRLAEFVDSGRLHMLEINRLPLESTQALEQYRTGHARGKTMLVVSD